MCSPRVSGRWTTSPRRSARRVANTSHHLRAMARAGVLSTRRDGTRIYYALASDRVGALWAALRDVASEHVAGLEKLAAAYLGDRDGVEVIDRKELARRLERGEVLVLDVRPEAEYTAGHIAGARSVPIGELRRHLRSLPNDADCRRVLPRPVLRLRRRRRARAEPERLPGSETHRRVPGVEASRPAGGSRERRHGRWLRICSSIPRRCASRCATSTATSRSIRTAPFTSTPVARWRPGSATTPEAVDALPDRAVESFAGVGNPFSLRRLRPGERVVDVGSGAGFDSFIAAGQVGAEGRVVGVDMTPEMLKKSRDTADALGFGHVEFREGLAESIPVEDGWADAVISNGVINLCADKKSGVRGDPPCAQARRVAAVRRHRQRPAGAARSIARHRSVDWLNRGRAAPCGLAEDARRHRLHRRDHR